MPIGSAILSLSHDSLPPRVPLSSTSIAIPFTGSVGGDQEIPLTGSGTYVVDLAMMPAAGLQGLRVEVGLLDATGAAVTTPVTLVFTGCTGLLLMPGAVLELANPGILSGGIVALSVVHTAAAIVKVSALG